MSNIVSIHKGEPVTTSLAIAEGVGNPHSSVIKLIRQNIIDLEEFGPLGFEIQVANRPQGGGANTEYATLNEQQATLLLTYMRNTEVVKRFKKALIRAFFEMRDALSRGTMDAANLSRMDILRLAIDSEQERMKLAEEVVKLEHQIEESASLVAFAKAVEVAPDAISVAEAAKLLGTGRNRLMALLRRHRWIMKRNEPYQEAITSGLMEVKLNKFEHPEDGLKTSITPLITGKGLAKLRTIIH